MMLTELAHPVGERLARFPGPGASPAFFCSRIPPRVSTFRSTGAVHHLFCGTPRASAVSTRRCTRRRIERARAVLTRYAGRSSGLAAPVAAAAPRTGLTAPTARTNLPHRAAIRFLWRGRPDHVRRLQGRRRRDSTSSSWARRRFSRRRARRSSSGSTASGRARITWWAHRLRVERPRERASLHLSDGGSAWLSDAQGSTRSSRSASLRCPTCTPALVDSIDAGGRHSRSHAHPRALKGTEGRPAVHVSTRRVAFIECRPQADWRDRTTDSPPSLYVGEYVTFDALSLRGVREFGDVTRARSRAAAAPRGFALLPALGAASRSRRRGGRLIACGQLAPCSSDRPNLSVLRDTAGDARRAKIPLGSRGPGIAAPWESSLHEVTITWRRRTTLGRSSLFIVRASATSEYRPMERDLEATSARRPPRPACRRDAPGARQAFQAPGPHHLRSGRSFRGVRIVDFVRTRYFVAPPSSRAEASGAKSPALGPHAVRRDRKASG